MENNIFYFRVINSIGGIETFFYELAKKYKDWDITIYYQTGNYNQILRLSKYVRVKKYQGEKIVCKKAFFNFNLDIIDSVEAEEYIQIAHGDYKAMGIKPNTHPKITKYLGVSKQVCEAFKEVTGFDTELVYNPFEVPKPKKLLRLVSATRLSSEKGRSRMEILMKELDKSGMPWSWEIYTDSPNPIINENVAYKRPRLDLIDRVAAADYLVQLSDNEGYCYSVIESLSIGVPVIVTPCPVFKELGVKNGKNGFILPFDMSEIPLDKIYQGLEPFTYKPKKDNWKDFLAPGKSTYAEERKQMTEVIVISVYEDLRLHKKMEPGDLIITDKARAEMLVRNNVARYKDG